MKDEWVAICVSHEELVKAITKSQSWPTQFTDDIQGLNLFQLTLLYHLMSSYGMENKEITENLAAWQNELAIRAAKINGLEMRANA